ncbi:SMI1/KNR4 family protein [Nannocystis bainbridge]|uniref:SMI1/KNR4 family protein n=1 Tax=Nannocystis bainbridge TaxID=2995303 RepID=A0ABT5E4P1_9BACT|nr:SMI1/KNR4 family protein [Nannocystis bainbridge]MDC0720836.1 SMI1/KNR4 family protein [Nannocystis bainbridge]
MTIQPLRHVNVILQPGLTSVGTSRELGYLFESRGAFVSESWLTDAVPVDAETLVVVREASSDMAERARARGARVVAEADVRELLGPPLVDYRARLEASLAGARENGLRILRLATPPGATDEQLARVEAKLGFALPAALRSFYQQMNGLSLAFHSSRGGFADGIHDPTVPLAVESRVPLAWHEAADEGGDFWAAIHEAPRPTDGAPFLVGVICIPDIETVFFTDWTETCGNFDADTLLFDAFHSYHSTALRVDRARGELFIVPVDDYFANLDFGRVDIEVYLERILVSSGSARSVSTKWPRVSADLQLVEFVDE